MLHLYYFKYTVPLYRYFWKQPEKLMTKAVFNGMLQSIKFDAKGTLNYVHQIKHLHTTY